MLNLPETFRKNEHYWEQHMKKITEELQPTKISEKLEATVNH